MELRRTLTVRRSQGRQVVKVLTLAVLVAAGGVIHAQPGVPLPAKLTTLTETTALRAGTTARLAMRVQLAPELHVQANIPSDTTFIPTVLTVEPPAGVTVDELVYPPAQSLKQEGVPEPLSVYGHDFVIGVRVTLAPTVEPGTVVISGRVRYQACNDKVCFRAITVAEPWVVQVVPKGSSVKPQHTDVFKAIAFGKGIKPPPKSEEPTPAPTPVAVSASGDGLAELDRFKVQLTTGGYLNEADFLKFIQDAESGAPPRGLFDGRGPLAILLLVLVGGLALNLTPCVLPMIPINLAIIGAGARAGSRQRGFVLGASYGAAMAVVYGLLGLVVILTAGTFGTINSSPWFNAGIAVLFVMLGLAMFDVIVIDFSRFSGRFQPNGANQGSVVLAFTMGGVAALLAGACVAPVVIQVVLFASDMYASGNRAALALPFALGVGMAIPWPIAGAGMAALPKPGLWMVRVKQVLGVVILATAVYYGYLAYTLFDSRRVAEGAVSSSVAEMLKSGWHSSLAAGLAEAERDRKPVLLDLWATWCKNCLTMDKTTLKAESVTKALEGYVKIKVQAEDLEAPGTADLMKRLDAVGLPAYAILRPGT